MSSHKLSSDLYMHNIVHGYMHTNTHTHTYSTHIKKTAIKDSIRWPSCCGKTTVCVRTVESWEGPGCWVVSNILWRPSYTAELVCCFTCWPCCWQTCLSLGPKDKEWLLVLITTSSLSEIMSSIGNYQNLVLIFYKSLNHVRGWGRGK